MAIIYSYPTVIPTVDDLLLGTDVTAAGNPTKNFTIESLITLIQGDDRGLGYVLNQSGDARFVNPDGSFGPNQSAFNFLNLQGTGSVAFASFSTVGGINIGGTIGSGFSSITSTNLTGALLSTGQAGQIASGVQAITQNPNDNSTRIATTEYVDSIVDPSILQYLGDATGPFDLSLVSDDFKIAGTANQIETTAATVTGNVGIVTLKFPTAGITLPDGSIATTQAATDDSTKVATTAFVRNYDDLQDLNFTDGANASTVLLNSETLTLEGTALQVTTAVTAQKVKFGLPASVTIGGTFTGTTFAGDLLGTINTATTGVTQAENNNTTLIATTAFVERAATAKTLSYQADAAGTGTMPFTMNLSTDDLDIAGGTNINTSTLAVTAGADPKAVITVNLDDAVTISGTMNADKFETTAQTATWVTTVLDGFTSITSGLFVGDAGALLIPPIPPWPVGTTANVQFQGNASTANQLKLAGTVSMSGDTVAAGVTYTNGGDVPLVSTISDSVVYNKTLSGFNATTGSVQDGDSIIEALERLQGQITTLPQGLVYQGVWSAAGTGGGTPDLTVAGTKVNGHFYICDTAGTATPNGVGTTPNDWDVRDWVIFADDGAGGGVDEWQKIDNSSLAGGSGTTNTITKWTNNQVIGNSTITDDGSTVTIADTVDFITQGNNTFGNTSADTTLAKGNVTLEQNLILAKGLSLGSSYGSAGQVLTSGGNINVANTWTTPTVGTVESVAASINGNSIAITGSPIIGSGTLAFTFGGASTQYVNGEGNLTTFPATDDYDYWVLSDGISTSNITTTATASFLAGTYITTTESSGSLTIDHNATTRTDTTSADAPAFGGTFEAVSNITTNGTGHVTAIDVATVTIPANPDMTAASAGTGGAHGLVVPSAAGDQLKFLRADATWVIPTNTEGVTAVTATAPISSTGGDTPVISHDASGVSAGTYDSVTVNDKGHVTAGTNPGGSGGGIFSGDQAIITASTSLAFTLNRATTGALIFDVWLTSETSTGTSVTKKYTVAHSNNATPVYNKIIDTGLVGANDFTVTFANAGSGLSVTCSIQAVGVAQNIGYTVQVGHDSTNALTFTPAS